MSEDNSTIRLAIGSFYEPAPLDAALVDLLASGLTIVALCLVGTRQAFRVIVQQPASHVFHEESALLRASPLQKIGMSEGSDELFATAGEVQRMLFHDGQWSVSDPGLLGAPGHPDGLANHLRQHAMALVVSPPTPALHQRSSRILLRHSQHTVRTHEFTPGKPTKS